MLAYWLFGLSDAMPVLLQVVLLVSKMEEERSKASAGTKLAANFLGGFVGLAAYMILGIAPTLVTFALIVFLLSLWFGVRIAQGGAAGSNAELGFNATMIIFGIFILKSDANAGAWSARIVQFVIGCSFAIGMEVLRAGVRGFVLKSDTERHLIAALDALSIHRPYFSGAISETLLEKFLESKPQPAASSLTHREREVVQQIAEGRINKEIAQQLSISVKTVETHRASAMHKLKLRTTADLVRYAIRNNIIQP